MAHIYDRKVAISARKNPSCPQGLTHDVHSHNTSPTLKCRPNDAHAADGSFSAAATGTAAAQHWKCIDWVTLLQRCRETASIPFNRPFFVRNTNRKKLQDVWSRVLPLGYLVQGHVPEYL